jgi:hypothetical protein
MQELGDLLGHYTQSYLTFCEHIRGLDNTDNTTATPEYFLLEKQYTISDAPTACMKHQGKLPEIRTHQQKVNIRKLVIDKDIKTFPAGIHYDTTDRLFTFTSTKEIVQFSPTTFEDFAYYDHTKQQHVFFSPQDSRTHAAASTHNFVYDFGLKRHGTIALYGQNTKTQLMNIVCQKVVLQSIANLQESLLMKMTAHTCIRDYRRLNETSNLIINEINSFKIDNNRPKRDTQNSQYNIECHTDSCKQLQKYITTLNNNIDTLHKHHIPTPQIYVYTIYKYLQLNHAYLPTFKQFFSDLQSSSTNPTSTTPETQLFHHIATQYTNKNSTYDSFFDSANNTNFLTEFNTWIIDFNSIPNNFRRNLTRKKRYLAAMGGGLMLANSISSASTGEAPLSWFGNVISSTLGLATRTDMNNVINYLQQHGTALSELKINQEQLFDTYMQVRNNLALLHSSTDKIELGAANLAMEQDNKLAIQNLQMIIQLTLLKLANTITTAAIRKVSPYAFTQQELEATAIKYSRNKIHISTDMNDVQANLLRNDSSIWYIFSAPVRDERSLYNFYEVRQIPMFKDKKTYKAKIDLKYFAITANTNEYSQLTESEYFICLTQQNCHISDVTHPINEKSHCTVFTFQSNTLRCDVELTNQDPTPYFAFYDNKTYFSVPEEVPVRIACQHEMYSTITDSTTQMISGIGMMEIKPSCTIILPDNNRYFSNPILEAEQLDSTNMMQILKASIPNKYNFSFIIPPPKEPILLPIPVMKPVNTSFVQQILHEITHPAKALSVTAIFFIIIFVFILFFILLCFISPCFRTWFRTCTFFKNPKVWWTTYKNYEIPDFNKLAPSNSLINRIRSIRLPFQRPQHVEEEPQTTQPANIYSTYFHKKHEQLRHTFQNSSDTMYPKIIPNESLTPDETQYTQIRY